MNLRELVQKPFWTPREVATVTGMSVTSARVKVGILRRELESQGFISLTKSKVPSKLVIERFNIDLNWLDKNGALDKDL